MDNNSLNPSNRYRLREVSPLPQSTISFQISPIDTKFDGKCRIFGANMELDESYNISNNMQVVVPECSHYSIKRQSIASPIRVCGILYTVSHNLQMLKEISIIHQGISSGQIIKTWNPSLFVSQYAYNRNQIKTNDLQLIIDADLRLEIDFLKGASASIVFAIVQQMFGNKIDFSEIEKRRKLFFLLD